MKLIVVRHGECEANVRGIIAGSNVDSPLTQHGIDEAKQVAEQLQGFHGQIVSSPLQRAHRTAEIIRDRIAPGAEIRIEPLFIERNVGDALGMPQAEYYAMLESGELTPANAETPEQMLARVQAGLEKLKADNQDTLLVTHTGIYRIMACAINGLDPNTFVDVPNLQNCEVKAFEI